VESGCCSNRERSKNCDEDLLISGCFSVGKESEGAEGWCFSIEAKQLLDEIVSSMRGVKKMMGRG
jgi:hypothetical protein